MQTQEIHEDREFLVATAAKMVSAHVANNPVSTRDLPILIESVYAALEKLDAPTNPSKSKNLIPAVPIKDSVHDDYIICLEDGNRYKSLKRHIRAKYGPTPDEYREKWGLRADYPMVAQNYSKARSRLAKNMSLGRKLGTKVTR